MASRPSPRPLVLTSQYGFDNLRPEIRRGEIERVRRGAYVGRRDAPLDYWDQRNMELWEHCAAIAATTSCTFAFSHATAAALLELEAPAIDRPEIVQRSRPCAGMAADVVRHYRPSLTEAEIDWVGGLPVTPVDRTAVDSALSCSPPHALAIVDAALRRLANVSRFERELSIERQEVVRAHLRELLDQLGPVRHVRRAREVLSYADGFAEKAGESWMRWLVLVQGLPVPELQLPVVTSRTTYYPDQMWPASTRGSAKPLIAEYDGSGKYDENPGDAVIDQTHREQLIKEVTGADFLRFTKRDRRDPNAAARRLLREFPATTERVARPLLLVRSTARRRRP